MTNRQIAAKFVLARLQVAMDDSRRATPTALAIQGGKTRMGDKAAEAIRKSIEGFMKPLQKRLEKLLAPKPAKTQDASVPEESGATA